jgi:hypothetical protein
MLLSCCDSLGDDDCGSVNDGATFPDAENLSSSPSCVFFEISCLLSLSSLVKIHRRLRASSFFRKYLRPEMGVFFIKFIFHFRKYTIIKIYQT